MKSCSKSFSALSFLAFAAVFALPGYAGPNDRAESCEAVQMSECDGSPNSCVMVFARVGERFRFDLLPGEEKASTDCSVGRNAVGEVSTLPEGLAFDVDAAALRGVPQKPGFFEFVVLQTGEGRTSEQVVLIDIQEHSFGSGGLDYASYVADGVR